MADETGKQEQVTDDVLSLNDNATPQPEGTEQEESDEGLRDLETLLKAENDDDVEETPLPSDDTATQRAGETDEQSPESESTEGDVKDGAQDDQDDELDALPEDNPKPDDWKRVREINKERRQRIRELEKKLNAQGEGQPTAPDAIQTNGNVDVPAPDTLYESKPEATPKTPETQYDPVFLVNALMRANMEDEQYVAYKPQIIEEMQKLDPRALADVGRRAQLGAFGEPSADMAHVVSSMLPLVQAEHQAHQREQEQRHVVESQRSQSWATVVNEMPSLRDRSSADYKRFAEANAELVTAIPTLWNVPDAPSVVRQYAKMKTAVSERDSLKTELAKLRKEKETLEKRLGNEQSPQRGGSQRGMRRGDGDTPDAELEKEMTELGLVHK